MAVAETLTVLLYDRVVGELVRERGKHTFTYDPAYAAAPDATPLSLSMPLAVAEHRDSAVLPFLLGLLPDNEAVLRRWGREFDVRPSNPFGLLAHVGEDCAGAVQLVRRERLDHLDPGDVTWLEDEQVAERIRRLRLDPTAWQLTGSHGQFSLAGAQAKTALHRDRGRWGVPSGRVPTTHILKPAVTGLDDHDLNEHLCLGLARRLGLTAARSRIVQVGDVRVVAVTRYDRIRDTSGAWIRVHQEDMCQALGVPPSRKYQADRGPSPEQIAGLLRTTAPRGGADAAVAAFVDALALNWIIAGTDAHAKNYSLLLSGRAVRLAPLYDVASVLPYGDAGGAGGRGGDVDLHDLRSAMRIGGEYALNYIGRDNWARLAASVGLDSDTVLSRVNELAERTPTALAAACAALNIAGQATSLPGRLLVAVSARAELCAARLRPPSSQVLPPSDGRIHPSVPALLPDDPARRPVGSWTAELAARLYADLAVPQRRVLHALVRHGGTLTAEELRELLNRDSFRGLTGPVTKTLDRLTRSGLLPPGLPRPVRSRYGDDHLGYRRLDALEIPAEVLPAWTAALGNLPVAGSSDGRDN